MWTKILEALKDALIVNWKTTATAIASSLVWVVQLFGVEVPLETATAFTAFVVSIGLVFAKDSKKETK